MDLTGVVSQAGESAYDDAVNIWNGAVTRRPAVVASCARLTFDYDGDSDCFRVVVAENARKMLEGLPERRYKVLTVDDKPNGRWISTCENRTRWRKLSLTTNLERE
jgi:hypothetical protein